MLRTSLLACLVLASSLAWGAVRELSWEELIPPGAAPAPEPIPLHDLSQGLSESGPAAMQAEPDAPVNEQLNGQEIKLPGYIVPLEISDEGYVTDFLLVPYYGACIHVPPPPSNQIVHVTSPKGVRLDELYQPFWIEGPLDVQQSASELATAGYRMAAQQIYPYE